MSTPLATSDRAAVHRAAAHNLAAWHHVNLRALGREPTWTDRWWSCPLPEPTVYHSAVQLTPVTDRTEEATLRSGLVDHLATSRYVSVGTPFDDLDLGPAGLSRAGEGTWLARAPGPLPPDRADPSARVERVTTADALAEFEQAMVQAFGVWMSVPRGSVHAPAVLDADEQVVFVARTDEGVVAAIAMAMRTEVVGIYGVGTRPDWRGRGFATAVTRACLEWAPGHIAVLQPTPAALSLYLRLGFATVGPFSHWR